MKRLTALLLIIFCLSALADIPVDSHEIVSIKNFSNKAWKTQPFELLENASIDIKCISQTQGDTWLGKAWILNSDSRQVVWELNFDNTQRFGGDGLRKCSESIKLEKGRYEACFGTDYSKNYSIDGIGDLVNVILNTHNNLDKDEWLFKLYTRDENLIQKPSNSLADDKNAIIQLINIGDNEHRTKGFSISNNLTVKVYCLGEGTQKRQEMYDYGYIVNAETRERVWEMNMHETSHAGGADKNRVFYDTIDLPAGDYIVHYISDDSHSTDSFNKMPPYDPAFWGITIWAENGDYQDLTIKPYSEEKTGTIAEITRVGDNEFLRKGFELSERTKVHIICLGEKGYSSHNLVDYGWIVDQSTQEIVWKMTAENSKHAGGASKNKIADEIITLDAGVYQVCYQTDDSHSYDDWNSTAPADEQLWGITLFPVNGAVVEKPDTNYEVKNKPKVLAQIIEMDSKEHRRKNFKLQKDAFVRIYAIGEGDAEEMYDYGWLEDETKNIVWLMEYDRTVNAGGAKKNRLINKVLELSAGSYTLHFETDDSHNFGDWNAEPPTDAQNWGITIRLEE